MPQDWVPEDWAEEQAARVAREVRRLRGSRSAQWVSDRTDELGWRVSRAVIADLENGRRRYVTTGELIMLALALDTTPMALMYPGPYLQTIDVMPDFSAPQSWATQWFSGVLRTISKWPFSDNPQQTIQVPNPDVYSENVKPFRAMLKMLDMDERRDSRRKRLEELRYRKRRGQDVPEDEIVDLSDEVAEYTAQIEEWKAGQGGDDDGR